MQRKRRGLIIAFHLVILAAGTAARGIEVEVAAGAHDRIDTPVVLALPESLAGAQAFSLKRLADGKLVDVQRLPGTKPSVIWIERSLSAGSTRRYELQEASAQQPSGVSFIDDGKTLRLDVGERPLLRYHTAVVPSPEGIDPLYRRSGHIHPLTTPSGIAVTDDFPPDHAHQHGIFFAWVNTTFQGRPVDFWNQPQKTGSVAHDATLGGVSGPVFGQFTVRLRHDDLTAPGGPVAVLNEVWTVRAYRIASHHVVDLESTQTCAGESPLKINAYHYGGFGIRGNGAWFDADVKGNDPPDPKRSGASDFLTSEGKGRKDGNHTRPRWVDLGGQVGDRAAGVAVLDHPANFRHPQPVRLHPNKPYFCFAPMVLGEFEIAPGKPHVSRYRLVVHDGTADAGPIERLWRDYADPPRVALVESKKAP